MTTHSKGPAAGFAWLRRGAGITFRHPKPLLGGAAILLLVGLLPMLVTLPMQLGTRTATVASPAMFGWVMLGATLLGLLIVPLYAGFMQVFDAAARDAPGRARDIFAPYRQGEALRLIGFGLAMQVVYFGLLAVVLATVGRDVVRWYAQIVSAQLTHVLPPAGLPPGFGITVALLMLVGLFLMAVYAIGIGQVALGRRSVLDAIGEGFAGALKNLLPLLVFALCLLLAWLVVGLCIGILGAVLMLLARFAGMWLLLVVGIPVYIALVLLAFSIMFGVMYSLWRDVCETDTAPPAPESHSVAA